MKREILDHGVQKVPPVHQGKQELMGIQVKQDRKVTEAIKDFRVHLDQQDLLE